MRQVLQSATILLQSNDCCKLRQNTPVRQSSISTILRKNRRLWTLYPKRGRCKVQAPTKGRNFSVKLTHLCGLVRRSRFWLDVSFYLRVKNIVRPSDWRELFWVWKFMKWSVRLRSQIRWNTIWNEKSPLRSGPFASSGSPGKTLTAMLEKPPVWCGFAPSEKFEKQNHHTIKYFDWMWVNSGRTGKCLALGAPDLQWPCAKYFPLRSSHSVSKYMNEHNFLVSISQYVYNKKTLMFEHF